MKGSDLWLMGDENLRHLVKLTMDSFARSVSARPSVPCTRAEVDKVLLELNAAVDDGSYIPETPTVDNPALSDDYIFTPEDKDYVLKDLSQHNFVGKVKDVGKGAKKRLSRGCRKSIYMFFNIRADFYDETAKNLERSRCTYEKDVEFGLLQ